MKYGGKKQDVARMPFQINTFEQGCFLSIPALIKLVRYSVMFIHQTLHRVPAAPISDFLPAEIGRNTTWEPPSQQTMLKCKESDIIDLIISSYYSSISSLQM